MKIFILYDKAGIHSGRKLGTFIINYLRNRASVSRGRPERLQLLLSKGYRFDYIINIGWFKEFNTCGARVLNLPQTIALSSNKKRARVEFKNESVPAPELWTNVSLLPPEAFPVVARTTHHSKGRGFWLCKSREEAARAAAGGATHFLKFIPRTREFRVHAIVDSVEVKEATEDNYKVFKLSEKKKVNGASNAVIKNHDNGWVFGYPDDRKDPALPLIREAAKKALAAFKLHWGAVDVILSIDTGKVYVLEINSTPCLTDDSADTLQRYSKNMCILLGLDPAPEPKYKKEIKIKKIKNNGLKSLLMRKNLR